MTYTPPDKIEIYASALQSDIGAERFEVVEGGKLRRYWIGTVYGGGVATERGQAYQIADIGLRMLTPRELYRAQGFPESYVIERGAAGEPITKTAQVRMCGNSVCPPLARAIVAANYAEQNATQRRAA